MDRIDVPSATPGRLFTEGSPTGGVPATVVSADWLNGVQEELIAVILAGGLTPDKTVLNQVLTAIQEIVSAQLLAGFTGSNQQLSSPHFQKLPGGTILQAGISASTTTSAAVTFPVAFPTRCSFVGTHDQTSSGSAQRSIFNAADVTRTGFVALNLGILTRGVSTFSAPGNNACPWFAIGY